MANNRDQDSDGRSEGRFPDYNSSDHDGVGPTHDEVLGPLVLRYLHGLAKPEEVAKLKEAISSNREAARYFVELCRLDTQLSEQHSPDQVLEDWKSGPLADQLPFFVDMLRDRKDELTGISDSRSTSRLKIGSLFSVAAATLLCATSFLSIYVYRASQEGASTVAVVDKTPSPGESDVDLVAEITRKVDCVWEDEKWKPGNRTHLSIGEVMRLDRGLVELEYRNGTIVLVEGPAQFTPVSDLKIALDFGAVSVRAAEGVEGFEVATPASRVIDVGTEFGVTVSPQGRTELRVYEGEVRLDHTIPAESADSFLVKENVSPDSIEIAKSTFHINVTDEALTQRSLEIEQPSVVPQMPVTRDLALWLSAGACVKRDRTGHVVGWGDLLTGDNQSRESAWQVDQSNRPTWEEDGMLGHPAVRFDGDTDYMVTEPLATTDEQTITALVKVLGAGRKVDQWRGNHIINYGGPPSIVLRYNWRKAGFAGKAFVGYFPEYEGPDAWVNVGRVVGSLFQREMVPEERPPQICSYVFSHRDNIARLYIDGVFVGESAAPGHAAIVSSKVIGAHRSGEDTFFNGSISELIIHNDSLSKQEVLDIHRSLADRYGLKLPQEPEP